MVNLYILKNRNNKYYIGITALNPIERLKRHNKGYVCATKFSKPWDIVYSEKHLNYEDARKREEQIKSWHGGNAFKKLIAEAAGSSNGRTSPFGGEYLGSNPSPAASAGRELSSKIWRGE